MRRTVRLFLAAAFAAAFVFPGPVRAAETSRAELWRARAETALARFVALDSGSELAHSYAFAAQTRAWLYGWDDPQALAWLDKVRSLRKPDGGYGLNAGYDFAGDGSTNPASTSYTVSVTDHVGPVIRDAYLAGAAPREELKALVDWVMATPRIQSSLTSSGQCVAYSRSSYDQGAAFCVHNVNASAATFLADSIAAGVGATGAQALIVDIARREVYAYQPTIDGRTAWWRYMDTRTLNDPDHNSFQAEAVYRHLSYPVGREAVYQTMVGNYPGDPTGPLVYLRLTGLPGGIGSMSADGTTTLWCVLGDSRWQEVDAFIAGADARRSAQAAYYAARNARNC